MCDPIVGLVHHVRVAVDESNTMFGFEWWA